MKHLVISALISMVVLAGAEHDALAQSTATDIVGFLVTNQSIRTGDAAQDRAAAVAARDTITRALLVNLTSVPIATSSSGFLYRLNPELGTVERATQSFGGFFVERAFSPGHGRATFGVSASSSSFDRLDNEDLRDGSFLTTANRFPDEPAPFETETPGYLLMNADVRWRLIGVMGMNLELFVNASNLGDEEARKHTSFVKDVAPLPGRNYALGIRSRF